MDVVDWEREGVRLEVWRWVSTPAHVRKQGAHTCIGKARTRASTRASTRKRKHYLNARTHTPPSTRAHCILSDARSPSSESESLIHSLSTRSKKFLYEHMLAKLLSCCGRAERSRGQ